MAMRTVLFAVIAITLTSFATSFATSSARDTAAQTEAEAIRAVIGAQLAAFQADDAELAFTYAAPSIKERFGSPALFMRMVKNAYRPLYQPSSIEFGPLQDSPHGLVQQVHLVGSDGRKFIAMYLMEESDAGEWRIAGCLLRSDGGANKGMVI